MSEISGDDKTDAFTDLKLVFLLLHTLCIIYSEAYGDGLYVQ